MRKPYGFPELMECIQKKNENGGTARRIWKGDLKPHLIEYIPVGSYILEKK